MNIHDLIKLKIYNLKFRFKCDCSFKFNFIGSIKDYQVIDSELVLIIEDDRGKVIRIGENHPGLTITRV